MKKLSFLITLALFLQGLPVLKAQQKVFVYFNTKDITAFQPGNFFSKKAIARRQQQHIAWDITDYPVNKGYVGRVGRIADSFSVVSRWLNGMVVYISDENQLKQIRSLGFVKKTERLPCSRTLMCSDKQSGDEPEISKDRLYLIRQQTARFGARYFDNAKANGKGIRIAVFDGGFPKVDEHPAFEHLRKENRIIATHDFIKDRENVYYGNSHGLSTLACIAGIYQGERLGLATGAEFLLAKTEINTEPYAEEEHWLAAAEWADKMGADIISSSLGYGKHRYFQSDMDGRTSLVVKAAEMAARKGILVVNSAGNEGSNFWRAIITPADGDSVLCVGGISPSTDYAISFTSFGPTADKRLKPNVSAYAHAVSTAKEGLREVDGTSFSCPLVAGFAACAWQLHPEFNNMDLFREIEHSGHLYPYFDYVHGYGIPQALHFTTTNLSPPRPTFRFYDDGANIVVNVFPTVVNDSNWLQGQNLLYYHIQNQDRWLKKYGVVEVQQRDALLIPKKGFDDMKLRPGDILRVHFRGYTATYLIN